jgi:hypothetical protein
VIDREVNRSSNNNGCAATTKRIGRERAPAVFVPLPRQKTYTKKPDVDMHVIFGCWKRTPPQKARKEKWMKGTRVSDGGAHAAGRVQAARPTRGHEADVNE